MALFIRKNFSFGYLASQVLSGATSLTVAAGHTLPTTAGKFRATIWNYISYSSPSSDPDVEVVEAEYSGTPNIYNITRAQESTSAATHSVNEKVSLTYTAGVAEADLSIVGTKEIDETAIGNNKVLVYNSSTGKIEYIAFPAGAGDMATSVYDSDVDGLIDSSIIAYGGSGYTTVKDALDALLYVTLTGSLVSNVNSAEFGSTISTVILTWSYNKDVTSQSLNNSIGAITPVSERTYTHGSQSITSNRTYTLTASDGTTTITPSTTISFYHYRYWGPQAASSISDAQIIALSKEFSTTRVKSSFSVVCAAQYIHYCYPASWGTASFTVNGLPNTDWTLTTANFTNASGNTTSFNKYRSNNLLTGTYNISVS